MRIRSVEHGKRKTKHALTGFVKLLTRMPVFSGLYQRHVDRFRRLQMEVEFIKLTCLTIVIGGWLSFGISATTDWDYLVFTQAWPVTLCIKNTHNGTEPSEKCIFPRNPLEWTIHGLWPNRVDGNNPSYCNKSVAFDESKIQEIRGQLEEVWPNLMSDKTADSLWKHEWEKHGTCALNFQPLNDERKYFEKGLALYRAYNMTVLLPSLRIFPEKAKHYSAIYIFNVIRNALSKAPYLECVEKRDAGSHYLSEIRLCFDKSFHLMDCIPTHFENGHYPLINCPQGSTIIYPKNIDS